MQNDKGASVPSSSNRKNTVYVAGLPLEINEEQLLSAFITFGDIIDIKIPNEVQDPTKHRGFAFITYSNPSDALDAIDNYDLNELQGYQGRGKFLKCSLANPDRFASEGGSNKFDKAIWSTDEWQAAHGEKPRDEAVEQAQQNSA
ncbi:uncharacterized protein I206_104312 [Kwoniella pini CBS 10737]|uniref:Cyclophilin n=1 Tax=Kwoniella pini CBS 10737 TaxID=1296096 RepID=A0A1B9I225_9TREE|nr:cyclophilin [Kwoniella pini CBS 10737]OCF49589.1 cyclophilin [Kwoniella pini CBS 10737]